MYLDFKKLHILIVEDILPMQQLTKQMLKALGVGIINTAKNGEDGYRLYVQKQPDIIITDWQMPELDGLGLIKKIRLSKDSPNRTIPIIMMTGFCAVERISLSRDNGSTEFIVKPFSANDLAARITHIIKQPRDFILTQQFAGPDRRRIKTNDEKDTSKRVKETKQKLKAKRHLETKTGMGMLNQELIQRSQQILDENEIDFLPIAKQFLNELDKELAKANTYKNLGRKDLENIISPIMQIKANAYIFKYELIGSLANIMLNFLENINEIDEFVVQIITAHQKTLDHLIANKMKSSEGDLGEKLQDELDGACKRYMNIKINISKKKLEQKLKEKA